MGRLIVHRLASWIAKYPKLSLGLVVTYVCLSFFELIPVVELVTDFMVILAYLLLLRYINRQRKSGQPL